MKTLLILLINILLFSTNTNKSYKENKVFKSSLGDIITLEYASNSDIRLNYNSKLGIDIEITSLYGSPILDMSFYESSNKFIFYGYIGDRLNTCDTMGYIYMVEKDFSSYDYYLSNIVNISSNIEYVIEYPYGYITIFEKDMIEDYSYTKVCTLDTSLNIVNEIELDSTLIKEPKIIYNHLLCDIGEIYYIDEELNIYNDYEREISKTGDFTLSSDLYVNTLLYKKGSHFYTPGVYILNDMYNECVTLTLDPIINGLSNDEHYNNYIEFNVSGGEVYVDDTKVHLNGIVSGVGRHTLRVKGIGGYIKEVSFYINPEILSDITSPLKEGDIITFTGYIKVDDSDYIEESYECLRGTHKIELYMDKESEPIDTYYIDVEAKLSKNKLIIIYIIEGVLLGGVALILVIIIRDDIKKRRLKS